MKTPDGGGDAGWQHIPSAAADRYRMAQYAHEIDQHQWFQP